MAAMLGFATVDRAHDAERLIADMQKLKDARCADCAGSLCGHAVLFSIALGSGGAPRCPACLAAALGWAPRGLREELVDYIGRKDCTRLAWQWAQARETACPLGSEFPGPAESASGTDDDPGPAPGVPHAAAWDAGDLGCGELVLELRMRLAALQPGQILELTARDLGAPQDLPAWCRLTGNTLARANHPEYWIRRKP